VVGKRLKDIKPRTINYELRTKARRDSSLSTDEKELLEEEIKRLETSTLLLRHSLDKCSKIVPDGELTIEELDCFEALSARFARTSDLLTQKIFRLIDRIELETDGSVIDRINRAERRGIVENSEQMKEIRRLRNDIAHEYKQEGMEELYQSLLRLTKVLLITVEKASAYCIKMYEGI
jgi:hypothetical protein